MCSALLRSSPSSSRHVSSPPTQNKFTSRICRIGLERTFEQRGAPLTPALCLKLCPGSALLATAGRDSSPSGNTSSCSLRDQLALHGIERPCSLQHMCVALPPVRGYSPTWAQRRLPATQLPLWLWEVTRSLPPFPTISFSEGLA